MKIIVSIENGKVTVLASGSVEVLIECKDAQTKDITEIADVQLIPAEEMQREWMVRAHG